MKRFIQFVLPAVLFSAFLAFYVWPAFQGRLEITPGFFIAGHLFRFYGFIMVSAILVGFFVARKYAPSFGITGGEIEDVLPYAVIAGFVGARVYYVVFSWTYFHSHLAEILQVWHGGLSIYGGVLGGFLGIAFYCRRRRIFLRRMLDILALGLPLAQSLGRWGNFFNVEAFGRPTTLPWRMFVAPELRPVGYLSQQFFHPTFLYEGLWDLAIFFILFAWRRKSGHYIPGLPAGWYMILYGLGRFFIEDLRLDSQFVHGLRIDQIASLLMIAAGGAIIYSVYEPATVENH